VTNVQQKWREKTMWIFTQRGFLSIVRHAEKENVLTVRSRFKGHIETIFPGAIVQEGAGTDYEYRSELPAKEVSEAIARMIEEIEYSNFKDSLKEGDSEYLFCALDVYDSVQVIQGGSTFVKDIR
jgi:hypothetical protein